MRASTRLLTTVVTTAALSVGAALHLLGPAAATSGTTAPPVKIMLAGDSITQGFSGIPTYRYWLWRELKRQGVDFDLVGPRATKSAPSRYLHAFDHDHNGIIGIRLETRRNTIGSTIAAFMPDVLVVMLGHNDMRHGASAAQTAGYMRDYLGAALASNPHMRVVVCEVMNAYFHNRTQRFPGVNAQFNKRLRTIASEYSTSAHPVTVADTQYKNWHPLHGDTKDGTHPTPTGGTKVAQRIGWALHRRSIGRVLPQRPRILAGHRSWSPKPIVTLIPKAAHRRLLVRWEPDVKAFSMTAGRVWYRDLTAGRSHHTGWHRHGYAAVGHLIPGHRYKVRLQPRARWLVGTLGPPAFVRFPTA